MLCIAGNALLLLKEPIIMKGRPATQHQHQPEAMLLHCHPVHLSSLALQHQATAMLFNRHPVHLSSLALKAH
jgi:hypothetical protein